MLERELTIDVCDDENSLLLSVDFTNSCLYKKGSHFLLLQ